MNLFRVFPYDPGAAELESGGALFRPVGGFARIDNPELYRTLYAADTPECALAEQFGSLPIWYPEMLVHAEGRPYVVATLAVPNSLTIWRTNDARNLEKFGLNPTDVITRNRKKTQAWAARVFELSRYDGISWWSYYNPDWTAYGLWNLKDLKVVDVHRLDIGDTIIAGAARSIVRNVVLK